MKILVIMGSPRKGNTYRACEEFQEFVQRDCAAEFEYVWLKDANIQPCKGCFDCFPNGESRCPNRDDDVKEIVHRMQEADGVIFASPVYSYNVSGLMKTFFDRISYIGHRPRFFCKKAFILVTTGSFGMDYPLDYMAGIASLGWGFDVIGKVGLITPNGIIPQYRAESNTKLLRKAARRYSHALRTSRRKSPGLKNMIAFHMGRGAFSQLKTVSPADHQYWEQKGWLSPDARYYMDAPINPLYEAMGRTVGWALMRKVRKDMNLPIGHAMPDKTLTMHANYGDDRLR